MASLTRDTARVDRAMRAARAPRARGLMFALVSAASFGLSGSLARGLMDAGWSAGAATFVRISIAAAVLAVPGILVMRGRWTLLRRAWRLVVAYGLFAVAGAQLFYFLAVGHLDVGVALLIEYMAPIVVVGWLWVRHGHRPGPLTLVGAAVAIGGMALLLDLVGGGIHLELQGVGWALLAMCGAAVYFIIGGDSSTGLHPVALAWGGLVVGAVALGVAALAGIVPFRVTAAPVALLPGTMPWWAVAVMLGVISAAIAYVTGIAATRRLGSRLGSFVALSEVIAAAGFAWLLLGQAPAAIQLAGAALVLGGVILVKAGERSQPALDVAPDGTSDAVPDAVPAAVVEQVEAEALDAPAERAGETAPAS